MTGDVATARQHAQTGIALTSSGSTVLKGRNVLGKLLLAESKWDEADSHFAEDGMLAAEQKDGTAELRARLNRGIALLSKGLPEEARVLFQSVLAEGERRNEARACAYALSNLGHLALQRHEYGASLEYWERAIKLLHAMRDRMAAARILANLAALRHILGLFDHAEHALSFGRRILGAGITSGRASHFDVVAARIALTRGHTIDARREIEAAILKSATDTDLLGEAHRVGARIALEDGDLPRAQQMLVRARELATKDMAHAEIALLQAHYERASGNCGVEAAKKALALARTAGEENLLRETHVLLAELYRVDGDTDAARTHLEQAAQLRDKVADRIPSDLRGAYLAKPDIAHLARSSQAQLAEPVRRQELTEEDAPRSVRAARPATSTPREIVGDDPAIRGLLAGHPEGRPVDEHGAHSRRERHREGARRRGASPRERSRRRARSSPSTAPRSSRRCSCRSSSGTRRAPSRARSRGGAGDSSSPRGDALPRRDWRHLCANAGRAPPGAPGADVRARRRNDPHPRQRPRRLRDPPRPAGDGRAGRVPRGPLLPAPRHHPRGAAASRAPRRPAAHQRPPPRAHRVRAR